METLRKSLDNLILCTFRTERTVLGSPGHLWLIYTCYIKNYSTAKYM